MKTGSLFSGVGGFEIGFESEGFDTRWFVEQNKYCQAVLRKNFPGKPIFEDIKTTDFTRVPYVDVIVGGFPCQDISISGKHKGIKGGRSWLWKEYARAIKEIRPRYAVIENSPLLASRGLNYVLQDLAEMGYDAEWGCLQASWFGNYQKRERMFIIAYLQNNRCKHSKHGESQGKSHAGFFKKVSVERRTISDKERLCEEIRTTEFVRKANGIPHRMDRVKCCGNAVVPRVAQYIAQQIKRVVKNDS